MSITCIDVGYIENARHPTTAIAACVVIDAWEDAHSVSEHVINISDVRDYEPGQFYLRELPCIEAVLATLPSTPSCVVVDGYVWLDENRPGLGKHLYDALGSRIPIIGVAKNSFKRSLHAYELFRGHSSRPLYVTSVGVPVDQAANHITTMHGQHRFPSALKRVDRLSRGEPAMGHQNG